MSATAQTTKAKETADALPLVDLHVEHASLTGALVHALAEMAVIDKSRTADAGSYKYDYADLADVVRATKTVLSRHGIAVRTPVHGHGDGLAVTVKFLHSSGETFDDEPLPFPRGRDAQATGSAITYFRRYALLAALNLATGDDDDGAKAIPAAPAPAPWNANLVKQRILHQLDGNHAHAKEAWRLGKGDELTEFSREVADRLAAEWKANQPAEPPAPVEGEAES